MGRIDEDPNVREAFLNLCRLLWPQFDGGDYQSTRDQQEHDQRQSQAREVSWDELSGFERLIVIRGLRLGDEAERMVTKSCISESVYDPVLRRRIIEWTKQQVVKNPTIRQAFLYCTRGDRWTIPKSIIGESSVPSEDDEKLSSLSGLLHPETRLVFDTSVTQLAQHRKAFRFHRNEALYCQSSIHNLLFSALPATEAVGTTREEQDQQMAHRGDVVQSVRNYEKRWETRVSGQTERGTQ